MEFLLHLLCLGLVFWGTRKAETVRYIEEVRREEERRREEAKREDERRREEVRRAEMLAGLATQVAHDIRSPLAVLEAASAEMSGVPEEQRIMIRRAAMRVHEIANSLLCRYVGRAPLEHPSVTLDSAAKPTMLSGLAEAIVREKRLEYRSLRGIAIEGSLDAECCKVFATVNATEFRRLLSNLINNAVEALSDGRGRVELGLRLVGENAHITVIDNGRGIAPEILATLGSPGTTHGKPGGSGLGLAHAKACAAAWGGQLQLASTVGAVTTVTLTLPVAPPPAWFVGHLILAAGEPVVILDDDTNIHQLWRQRLEAETGVGMALELVHAFSPADLRAWVSANPEKARAARYLLDYHLAGHAETGLDLAEALCIADRTVLVTSAYDDPTVMRRCEELGVKLLPKNLATLVPIRVLSPGATAPTLFDAVLIDDDELVRKLWAADARSYGRILTVFSGPADFLAAAQRIDRRSPIYIDHVLSGQDRGDRVAGDLWRLGFRNLYLATGEFPDAFRDMPWIKGVVGKSSPWRRATAEERELVA